jgi:hypothetical protein
MTCAQHLLAAPSYRGQAQAIVASTTRPVVAPTARVGKPAPEFETHAYIDRGFRPLKLLGYKGKRGVMDFYPGDFTLFCTISESGSVQAFDEAAV